MLDFIKNITYEDIGIYISIGFLIYLYYQHILSFDYGSRLKEFFDDIFHFFTGFYFGELSLILYIIVFVIFFCILYLFVDKLI